MKASSKTYILLLYSSFCSSRALPSIIPRQRQRHQNMDFQQSANSSILQISSKSCIDILLSQPTSFPPFPSFPPSPSFPSCLPCYSSLSFPFFDFFSLQLQNILFKIGWFFMFPILCFSQQSFRYSRWRHLKKGRKFLVLFSFLGLSLFLGRSYFLFSVGILAAGCTAQLSTGGAVELLAAEDISPNN